MKHFPCSDTDKSWQEGVGKYLRLRYLLTLTSVESILAVISYIKLQLPYAVMVIVIFVTILTVIYFLRCFRVRISKLNSLFHRFTHTLRDQTSATLKATVEGGYKYAFQEFNSTTSENVALFFRALVNNSGITCAIRLAYFSDDKEHYVTVGRSSEFDLTRKENSQPIPSDEGVARLLRQKSQLGVIIVDSIADAIKRNTWYETKNDQLPDVKSVMVAPINGYVEGKKSMIGLLYIGAKKDIFSQYHVDIIRGFADCLGTTYPMIIGHIEQERENGKRDHCKGQS